MDENNFSLPEWHQQLVTDELKRITDNPALLKDWGTVKKEQTQSTGRRTGERVSADC